MLLLERHFLSPLSVVQNLGSTCGDDDDDDGDDDDSKHHIVCLYGIWHVTILLSVILSSLYIKIFKCHKTLERRDYD